MKNRNLDHKDDWETPIHYIEKWKQEYKVNFDFDPCPIHHDLSKWDGLKIDWKKHNYVNPPYSDDKKTGYLKTSFVLKGIAEMYKGNFSLFLLPVSTSTDLWHDIIQPHATAIDFQKRRIPFIGINKWGQYVNYHLKPEFQAQCEAEKDLMITCEDYNARKKHVKAAGQHDSVVVVFDGRKYAKKYSKIDGFKSLSELITAN